ARLPRATDEDCTKHAAASARTARSSPRRHFPCTSFASAVGRQRGRTTTWEEENMNRTRLALLGLVNGAVAAVAVGQNADKNTSGPTKNDYRLKVVEPAEGASITGPTVRVIVNTQVTEQIGDSEKRDVNSMPRPDVDVFLDDTLKGSMRDENNVLEIESVPAGTHKLVLVAKNRSNEIIDRKE